MSTPRKKQEWPACKWTTAQVDTNTTEALVRVLSISPTLARCLAIRRLTEPNEVEAFLAPKLRHCVPPTELPGINEAAEHIVRQVTKRGRIVVFGDYDADGITASTALARAITRIGGLASIFIPNRIIEGYGFTPAALHRCLKELGAIDLIVTVDCGTTQGEACRLAAEQGIEVVITDHHSVTDTLPETPAAIVNPDLPGTPTALRHLCGAGVAFKLAHELAKRMLSPEEGRQLLESMLPLIAIGTVADLVPLTGENRMIVSKGLELLNRPDCGGNQGIRALKLRAGLSNITATDLGFVIAPRINAAGRVGIPASALTLLEPTSTAQAMKAASILEEDNLARHTEETTAVENAQALVERARNKHSHSIVLYNTAWHPGVIGLVASRLASSFKLPTIIMTSGEDGTARGSARCPEHPELDLMALLERCSPLLNRYGGHRVAAGLSLPVEQVSAFQASFDRACAEAITGLDLRHELAVDAWINPEEINETLQQNLQKLEPCGVANTPPRLGIRGVTLKSDPKSFGKAAQHWNLSFAEIPYRCIVFRRDSIPFQAGTRLDIIFTLSSSLYDDIQLILQDAAPNNA